MLNDVSSVEPGLTDSILNFIGTVKKMMTVIGKLANISEIRVGIERCFPILQDIACSFFLSGLAP